MSGLLKVIHFENELLPDWAGLLDLAALLCSAPDETRRWFSRFTSSSGVDDARTALIHCEVLLNSLRQNRAEILSELGKRPEDNQASQIYNAWIYALETMIQQVSIKKTCSWHVEGSENADDDDSGGGDITLKRV